MRWLWDTGSEITTMPIDLLKFWDPEAKVINEQESDIVVGGGRRVKFGKTYEMFIDGKRASVISSNPGSSCIIGTDFSKEHNLEAH